MEGQLNILLGIITLVGVIISILVTGLKTLNKTYIEVLLLPQYKRTLHQLTLFSMISLFIIITITYLADQTQGTIDTQVANVGIISFSIFLSLVVVIIVLGLISERKKNSHSWDKMLAILCFCSFILLVLFKYSSSYTVLNNNNYSIQLLALLFIQLIFSILVLFWGSYFMERHQQNHSRYSVTTIPHKDHEHLLKKAVLINYVEPDKQILKPLHSNDLDKDTFPQYIYHTSSGLLQKVAPVQYDVEQEQNNTNEKNHTPLKLIKSIKKRQDQDDDFNYIIWNKRAAVFSKYIMENFNLTRVKNPEEVKQLRNKLNQLDQHTLKRAYSRAKTMTRLASPTIMIALFALLLQLSAIYPHLIIYSVIITFAAVFAVLYSRHEQTVAIQFIDLLDEIINETSIKEEKNY